MPTRTEIRDAIDERTKSLGVRKDELKDELKLTRVENIILQYAKGRMLVSVGTIVVKVVIPPALTPCLRTMWNDGRLRGWVAGILEDVGFTVNHIDIWGHFGKIVHHAKHSPIITCELERPSTP